MDLLLGRGNARNNVCDERGRGVWYIALLGSPLAWVNNLLCTRMSHPRFRYTQNLMLILTPKTRTPLILTSKVWLASFRAILQWAPAHSGNKFQPAIHVSSRWCFDNHVSWTRPCSNIETFSLRFHSLVPNTIVRHACIMATYTRIKNSEKESIRNLEAFLWSALKPLLDAITSRNSEKIFFKKV